MAIFSLHHKPIGKATQRKPHTASAHIRYITRPEAASRIEGARMPTKAAKAAGYLKQMEDGDRANARVVDKVRLALPVELDAEQRAQLVRDYAEDLTQGRASWLAAFHDKGEDAHNPHCHLVVRDRDHESGKRVIGMSEAGSTEKVRALWETHANRALERAGHEARIDRRTLAAQGIQRAPTIHEGPRAQAMDRRGAQPRSQVRERRNGRGARQRSRQVDYPRIDNGRSRPAYNRALRPRETKADFWAAIDADKRLREFESLGLGADARRAARQAENAKQLQEDFGGARAARRRQPPTAEGQGMNDAEKEPKTGFLGRIGQKAAQGAQRVADAHDRFLHDPSKPVKMGKDAPLAHETGHGGPKGDYTTSRAQTPAEQQQMSYPEAIYKKGIKPLLGKGAETEKAPAQQAAKPQQSFSERQAAQRAAAPPAPQKSFGERQAEQRTVPMPPRAAEREREPQAQNQQPATPQKSFSERQAEQRAAPPNPQRSAENLKSMQKGRELDKERGR